MNYPRSSRYFAVPQVNELDGDRVVRVLELRLSPHGSVYQTRGWIQVQPSDRADLLANRALGTPAAAWQLFDANDTVYPDDLVQPVGRQVRVGAKPVGVNQ